MLPILKGNPFIQIRNGEPWVSMFSEDIGAIGETTLIKEARKQAIRDNLPGSGFRHKRGLGKPTDRELIDAITHGVNFLHTEQT